MKRILLSLVISLVLIATYFLGAYILLDKFLDNDEQISSITAAPLRLPVYALDYFHPEETDDYVFALVVYLGNVFLYAFPIYGILSLIARRKPIDAESPAPPPPPTFDA